MTFLLGALSLGACTPALPPEQAARERAEAYWAAMLVGDYITAYRYEALSTESAADLQGYLTSRGGLQYSRAEVLDVRLVAEDRAEVLVALAYRLPMLGTRDPIEAEAWSDWVLIDGAWYHRPQRGSFWR
ncbi:hypothetical protein ABC977_04245 [Thioalkalicoccus limnaeus]|uniref:NTF2-like N-terminal transpeptidase domain-containing protein n=1 Tax=Thioalkalicoccus limnaeus TaxID=120681 RepID=A0ABV4BAY1_9GAMM